VFQQSIHHITVNAAGSELSCCVFGKPQRFSYINGKKVNEGEDFKVPFPFDSRVRKVVDGTAKILLDRRRELGLSMKEVAEKAGVCVRTIEKYEDGVIKDERCSLEVLLGLANALGIEHTQLLTPYHQWLLIDTKKDITELLAQRQSSVDVLAKECGTTHCSLYHWRDGVGVPNYQTFLRVSALRSGQHQESES